MMWRWAVWPCSVATPAAAGIMKRGLVVASVSGAIGRLAGPEGLVPSGFRLVPPVAGSGPLERTRNPRYWLRAARGPNPTFAAAQSEAGPPALKAGTRWGAEAV